MPNENFTFNCGGKRNLMKNRTKEEKEPKDSTLGSFFLLLVLRVFKDWAQEIFDWNWCFEIFLVKEVVFWSFWSITIFCNRKAARLAGLEAFLHLRLKIKPLNKKWTLGSKKVESLYLGKLNCAVKILLVTSMSGLKRTKPHGSLA